ncbi:sulfotransferase [Myxosarcina sp. GI1]|uniref:sulfotransferase family protein n=1 Tax=Myxosarcina sp. GI1 TaxID=1541065 RepID=UPI0005625BA5|nr:sulfotransferase [Myxosarcina sp. GI1]
MAADKPIFILGAPRSGTTWLGKTFEQHPDIDCWYENNAVWSWGNSRNANDVLTEQNLTPKIKSYIKKRFAKRLEKSGKKYIVDKTPRNCLRIPFLHAVFPDAKVIMLIRDGRSVINSTKKELNKPKGIPWIEIRNRLKNVSFWEWYTLIPRVSSRLKSMLGVELDFWGARPPGWSEWIDKYSTQTLLAKQWAATMTIGIKEGRKLPSDRYIEVRYEDLINNPQEEFTKLINFLDIENPSPIIDFAKTTGDPNRINKWKKSLNQNILDEIKEIMEPTMIELGYSWE